MNVKSRVCLFGTFAVVCAAGLFSTGCRTAVVSTPVVVPDPNAGTSIPQAPIQKYEPQAVESFLKVKAVSTFAGKEGAKLNQELLKTANAVFVERGFKVSDDAADVLVTLSPSATVYDKTGEYVLMEGKADAVAALPADGNRQIATKSFAVKGERKLGAEKAEQDVADKLADQFKAWARNEITVEKTGLVAKNISVKCKYHDDVADPAYISRFIDAVKSMEGVSDCSLVSQDNGARRFEFRTVYKKAAYPGGLLNALVVRHPELNLVLSK